VLSLKCRSQTTDNWQLTKTKDQGQIADGDNVMHSLFRDLRYSLRMLSRNKSFTAVAVLSIALGIGANTTVFSVINAVLLKSLPYKDPNSVVLVWGDVRSSETLRKHNQVSATDVADYRTQANSLEDVATYTGWNPIMSGDNEAEIADC
jgi:putative ABC transport system permease protein